MTVDVVLLLEGTYPFVRGRIQLGTSDDSGDVTLVISSGVYWRAPGAIWRAALYIA